MEIEELGGGYKRHEGVVYFSTSPVPKADAATFRYLGGCWARDATRIYSSGTLLKAAAIDSFRVLSYVFAKDAQQVFYLAGVVPEADVSTFEALDSGCRFGSPGKYPVSWAGYGADAGKVFHHILTIGKPCVVRNAERASFRSLDGLFGVDARAVFVDKRQIKDADPGSWFRLQGLYSRDHHRVYYDNAPIEGADLESFICLWGGHGTWAKDRSLFYDIGRPTTRERYFEQLDHEAEHLAKIRENLLAGNL